MRARWIPTSHNIPGFTAGVGGTELLSKLEQQCRQYGAHFVAACVTALTVRNELFVATARDQALMYGRYVLLATGVTDHLPSLAGASEAVLRSVVRFCPICDAFEAIRRTPGESTSGDLRLWLVRRWRPRPWSQSGDRCGRRSRHRGDGYS